MGGRARQTDAGFHPGNPVMNEELSLYFHIPFCARHCAYCDFNTYTEPQNSPLVQAVVEAMEADLRRCSAPLAARPLSTVFFGGGTPTFLPASQQIRLLQTARECLDMQQDAEISTEANPSFADSERFAALRCAGFNRISIGVQALHNGILKQLDRTHTAEEAVQAFDRAREAGFENISLDLMFRLPGQTLTLWKESVEAALSLQPEHLSLYSLTLEPGTRFERLHAGGRLALPDEETDLQMYRWAIWRLQRAGYVHYEVSNFAKPGHECRHNLGYWYNREHLGIGPGAVSYLNGERSKRERLPARYVQKVHAAEDLFVESERLAEAEALGETIMLGLRLRSGIVLQPLEQRFGISPLLHYAAVLNRLQQQGLVQLRRGTLRLSRRGLFLADTVAAEFVG